MSAPKPSLHLTTKPEAVNWPEMHYVFVEKIGAFQNTAPQAWGELHGLVAKISQHNQITGYTSLYKMREKVYRAGVSVAAEPKELPAGVQQCKFHGGKYRQFVLTGPYSNLPDASGRVMQMVEEQKIAVRDDFYIENYVNDPRTTPEAELITQILIPTV